MDAIQQAIITWVRCDAKLPPLNEPVLIHRVGGVNNHDDVYWGYRRHKYGTRDDWEWVETSEDYWGVSCDGSAVVQWADKPATPVWIE